MVLSIFDIMGTMIGKRAIIIRMVMNKGASIQSFYWIMKVDNGSLSWNKY